MNPVIKSDLNCPDESEMEANRRLVGRFLDGDEQAYEELVEKYSGQIYNVIYRITLSQEDAAEATQDVFLNFFRQIRKVDHQTTNIAAYIFKIAHHAALDKIRKRRKYEFTDSVPEPRNQALPIELDPERTTLMHDSKQTLEHAHRKLSERYREILALRELDDMSYEEIAEATGLKANNIAQLVYRARIKLRDELRLHSAAKTPQSDICKRALPLFVQKTAGELTPDDMKWLNSHLDECTTCTTNLASVEEAGEIYRGWVPLLPPVGLIMGIRDAGAAVLATGQTKSWMARVVTSLKVGRIAAGSLIAVTTGAIVFTLIQGSGTEHPLKVKSTVHKFNNGEEKHKEPNTSKMEEKRTSSYRINNSQKNRPFLQPPNSTADDSGTNRGQSRKTNRQIKPNRDSFEKFPVNKSTGKDSAWATNSSSPSDQADTKTPSTGESTTPKEGFTSPAAPVDAGMGPG